MSARTSTAANGTVHQNDAATPAIDGALSAVSREIQNVIADAEDLVKATTSLTGEDLARVREQLAKGIAAAKVSIEEMGGAIAVSARKTAATTNAYVHAQPWAVIGASAAAAFLLGMLIARRN